MTRNSVRVLVPHAVQNGHEENLHIDHQRPVLDVVQIVLDAHAHRCVSAPAVHLRPTGHSRAHFVPQHIVRKLCTKLLYELRALGTGPDDAHVAEEDVEELRELVEGPRPNPPPYPRSPRIIALGPFGAGVILRADPHRAEFHDLEWLAIETHAHLPIENRSAVFDPDCQRDEEHDRREENERGRRHREIEAALDEAAPAFQRRLGEIDRRQAVDVLDARAQHHELQQVGNDVNGDDASCQPLEQRLRCAVRQRDENVVDRLLFDHSLYIFDPPETFEMLEPDVVILQVADNVEPQLAVQAHALDDRAGEFAVAGDQHAIEVSSRAMPQVHRSANEHSSGDDEQNRADHEDAEG